MVIFRSLQFYFFFQWKLSSSTFSLVSLFESISFKTSGMSTMYEKDRRQSASDAAMFPPALPLCTFLYKKKNKANIFPLFLLRRPAVFILLILYISSLYIFLFAVISLYVLSFFVAANHLTFGRHVRSCKYSNYLSPATPCKPTKKSNQSIANIKTVNHRFSEKQNKTTKTCNLTNSR